MHVSHLMHLNASGTFYPAKASTSPFGATATETAGDFYERYHSSGAGKANHEKAHVRIESVSIPHTDNNLDLLTLQTYDVASGTWVDIGVFESSGAAEMTHNLGFDLIGSNGAGQIAFRAVLAVDTDCDVLIIYSVFV